MKTLSFLFTVALLVNMAIFAQAQNVGINSTGLAPDNSAMLDVRSDDKGLLIPRVALTSSNDISTIPSPAESLLVYNTANATYVTPGYYFWSGSVWIRIGSGTIPVENGGTGATNAAGARTSLGLGTAAQKNTGESSGNVPVLGSGGKLPATMLDVSGLTYLGSITLTDGQLVTPLGSGSYYVVSNIASIPENGVLGGNPISFSAGDWMISNGTVWQRITNSTEVSSVAGKIGAVELAGSDITSGVVAVANGGTGQTTVATAINALLPSQTSNSGKYLTTNGSAAAWGALTSSQWATTGSNIYYNSGNVGIGTNAPGTKLHVDNGALYIHGIDNTANNYTLLLRNQNTDNMMVVYNDGTTYMKGNVGIGTTTPAYKLDISSATSSGRQDMLRILAGSNSTGNGASMVLWSTQTHAGYISGLQTNSNTGDLTFGTQSNGTYAEKMRIVGSNGNVGIGTTTPGYKLHVAGGTIRCELGANGVSGAFLGGGSNLQIYHNSGSSVYFWNTAGGVYEFYNGAGSTSTGTLIAGAFNTGSDHRLKNNIVNTHFGINDLMKIQVRDYV